MSEMFDVGKMDFFQLKLLHNKEVDFFTHNGKAFFYHEGSKYDCGDSYPGEKTGLPDGIKGSGPLWFWQKEEYWVLSFLDRAKKLQPVMLRAGNVLQEAS